MSEPNSLGLTVRQLGSLGFELADSLGPQPPSTTLAPRGPIALASDQVLMPDEDPVP